MQKKLLILLGLAAVCIVGIVAYFSWLAPQAAPSPTSQKGMYLQPYSFSTTTPNGTAVTVTITKCATEDSGVCLGNDRSDIAEQGKVTVWNRPAKDGALSLGAHITYIHEDFYGFDVDLHPSCSYDCLNLTKETYTQTNQYFRKLILNGYLKDWGYPPPENF
jgi:hypothetical protein